MKESYVEGRKRPSMGPHAARGPPVWHACLRLLSHCGFESLVYNVMIKKICSQTWANGHLRIATTCSKRPPFWGPKLNLWILTTSHQQPLIWGPNYTGLTAYLSYLCDKGLKRVRLEENDPRPRIALSEFSTLLWRHKSTNCCDDEMPQQPRSRRASRTLALCTPSRSESILPRFWDSTKILDYLEYIF